MGEPAGRSEGESVLSEDSTIPTAGPQAHLAAEDITAELKQHSTRSGVLMILSHALQFVVGIGGTAVIARLLTPRDFGYLAMVGVLLTFVITIREFILGPVVHRQDLTQPQASGLFWLNALASMIVAAGVALMAPVLAWFFRVPEVQAITLVLSVGVLVNMLGMVHVALLRRQMRFGLISLIEITSMIVGVSVGISSAWLGASYWALVYQQLAVWVWQTLFGCVLCPWQPASPRRSVFLGDEGIRSMLRYGQAATASRVVTYVSRNVDGVLVGYFLGAGWLGLYQKAYQWAMMPFWQVFIPMTPVAVASLSKLQAEPQRYRVYVRATLMGLFALTLPGTALLMVEADAAIRILLGIGWEGAVPLLRVLCVGAFFSTLTVTSSWIFLSEGRTTEQLRWALMSAPVTIVGVSVGMYWGAMGVASGFAIAITLLAAPTVWYSLRRSSVTIGDVIDSFWRPAVSSILAAIALAMLKSVLILNWPVLIELVIHSAIYGVLYIICWLILPGGWSNGREFLRHFRELRRGGSA